MYHHEILCLFFILTLLILQHITTVIPNFAQDSICNGDDSVMPPFQLGEELADNALNTDSTTPQVWRYNS